MIDLDDPVSMSAADPSDMLGTIAALPIHCREAFDAALGAPLPPAEGISSVIVCGMGGSAMSGDVVRSVFGGRVAVPIEVNRSPRLPGYAGPSTLVVASSYSGETAETLAAFEESVARGCRHLVVSAGGTLGARAAEIGAPIVEVPVGFQPRAALGHLAFAAIGALEAMGLLPPSEDDVAETVGELQRLVSMLGPGVEVPANAAKRLAALIGERVPVVWGAEGIGSVAAMRWKCQLNENGKVPAFSSSMSELDHNEVVGWTRPYGAGFTLISLRHDGEPPELSARFDLSYEIAKEAGVAIEELRGGGQSALARLMGLIVAGDFTSAYVALRRGVDPTPVDAIMDLKAALSEVAP